MNYAKKGSGKPAIGTAKPTTIILEEEQGSEVIGSGKQAEGEGEQEESEEAPLLDAIKYVVYECMCFGYSEVWHVSGNRRKTCKVCRHTNNSDWKTFNAIWIFSNNLGCPQEG
jgi:hypothetical protein